MDVLYPSSFSPTFSPIDVLVNYSYEDIGNNFVSHLKRALISHNKDSESLEAIQESEIYLVIFSPRYAFSKRCLDELVNIVDQVKLGKKKLIPVFFKVIPSDVRRQEGSFKEAFEAHKTKFDLEMVDKWKQALKEAAKVAGYELQNREDEGKFVSKIVKEVGKMRKEQETRDKQSLGGLSDDIYDVSELDDMESVELFTRLMYNEGEIVDEKFVSEVVDRAGGLPLVLEVWSALFKHHGKEQWPTLLKKLKRIPHGDVQKQLQISYDELHYRAKKLFLDIACFFHGMKKDLVVKVLHEEDSAAYPDIDIQYLVDKCLLKIDKDYAGIFHLRMDHAIMEIGQEIVRCENEQEPGKRSRVWDERDVVRLLTECSGTDSVESIQLSNRVGLLDTFLKVEALRKMRNLRLIKLYTPGQAWIFSDIEEIASLSFKKLYYLELRGFPFKSIDMLDMPNVVYIILTHSKLETLWKGFKSLKKLRHLDVSYSTSLTKTGNFFGLENLEELCLHACENLEELDNSIGRLHQLGTIELSDCKNMKSIPNLPPNITLVKATGCRSLVKLPSNMSELKLLRELDLEGCSKLGLHVADHHLEHLKALGSHSQFIEEGSRTIMTSRDKQSLGGLSNSVYNVRELDATESVELFTRLMFEEDDFVDMEFVSEVVDHAGGLPLVLEVWSAHFKEYKRERWPTILEILKRIPFGDVQKQLQMSYDSLPNRAKKLFLDIACFFDGEEKDLVVNVLQDEGSAFFPDIAIEYLVDKCLLKVDNSSGAFCLRMNHAIREMGQEIVCRENVKEPGKRSRLWDERDVVRVLTECSGTESIESIRMYPNVAGVKEGEVISVEVEAFRKMTNLRLIGLRDFELSWSSCDDEDMPSLSFKKLKYLEWWEFPFKSIDMLDMANVVVIKLHRSKLETLWEGFKSLKKLRTLDVSYSKSLTKTGNFYGLEILEELILNDCWNLKELDSSIGQLHQLGSIDSSRCDKLQSIPNLPLNIASVYASDCRSLVNIPSNMSELKLLTELDLGGCSKLGSDDPECLMKVSGLRNLKTLKMGNCNVSHVPEDIGNLVSLESLILSENTFTSLPDSFSNLSQLDYLGINDCSELQRLPLLPSTLTRVQALKCWSLNVTPFDSMQRAYFFRTKVYKESPFTRPPLEISLSQNNEVPNDVSYGNLFSFVAPMDLNKKICGIILYATIPNATSYWGDVTPEVINITTKTSFRLRKLQHREINSMCVMFYPLDDTTLVVEAGDTVQLQFCYNTRGYRLESSCRLSLIYEGDVLDSKILIHGFIKLTPSIQTHISS